MNFAPWQAALMTLQCKLKAFAVWSLFMTALCSPYFIRGIDALVCANGARVCAPAGGLCRTAAPEYVVIILSQILVCSLGVSVCDGFRWIRIWAQQFATGTHRMLLHSERTNVRSRVVQCCGMLSYTLHDRRSTVVIADRDEFLRCTLIVWMRFFCTWMIVAWFRNGKQNVRFIL